MSPSRLDTVCLAEGLKVRSGVSDRSSELEVRGSPPQVPPLLEGAGGLAEVVGGGLLIEQVIVVGLGRLPVSLGDVGWHGLTLALLFPLVESDTEVAKVCTLICGGAATQFAFRPASEGWVAYARRPVPSGEQTWHAARAGRYADVSREPRLTPHELMLVWPAGFGSYDIATDEWESDPTPLLHRPWVRPAGFPIADTVNPPPWVDVVMYANEDLPPFHVPSPADLPDSTDPEGETREAMHALAEALVRPGRFEAPLLRIRLQRGDDGSILRSGFEVDDPTGAITTRWLRKLGNSAALSRVDEVLEGALVGEYLGEEWRRRVHRPGRSGRPDAYYAEWALRYVAALGSESAVRTLVEEEIAAGRHTTEAAVRAYINKARTRGLLTQAPSGRAGGELTKLGKRVLRDAGLNVGGTD